MLDQRLQFDLGALTGAETGIRFLLLTPKYLVLACLERVKFARCTFPNRLRGLALPFRVMPSGLEVGLELSQPGTPMIVVTEKIIWWWGNFAVSVRVVDARLGSDMCGQKSENIPFLRLFETSPCLRMGK